MRGKVEKTKANYLFLEEEWENDCSMRKSQKARLEKKYLVYTSVKREAMKIRKREDTSIQLKRGRIGIGRRESWSHLRN